MSPRATDSRPSRAVPFPVVALLVALLLLAALASPVRAAEEVPFPPPPELDLDLDPDAALEAMDAIFLTAEPWGLDPDLEFDVLDLLLLEIALIEHLDGFVARDVWAIEDIHAAYAPWPDVPAAATRGFLFSIDDELAELKTEVIEELGAIPHLAEALDEMPAGQRNGLTRGDTGIVPAAPYLRALNEILSFGNTETLMALDARNAAIVTELPIVLPIFAGPFALEGLGDAAPRPGTGLVPTTGPAASPAVEPVAATDVAADAGAATTAEPGDRSPWLVLAAIAGGGVLLGIVLTWVLLQRRNCGRDDTPVTELVFEAHRRLTTALDEGQIAEIAGTTARAITDASDAFVFRHTPDGLRLVGESTVVVRSALQRVIETAQPLVAVLDDDPAVASAAVCGVPIVADGRVGAVLVVRRPGDRPFGNEDRRRLEMLAPALGGALASADTLGSYEHMALVDGLTSLGNRRRLDGDLETALSEASLADRPVAFAMIDVDHFKHYNDTHGHEAGDRALQTVARVIAETVRAEDIVYRYGGEEFSVLLPGATRDEAMAVAERIRAAVQAAAVEGEGAQPGGRLTVSVGVSTLDDGDGSTIKSRADQALYDAKAQGRNRAVLA